MFDIAAIGGTFPGLIAVLGLKNVRGPVVMSNASASRGSSLRAARDVDGLGANALDTVRVSASPHDHPVCDRHSRIVVVARDISRPELQRSLRKLRLRLPRQGVARIQNEVSIP